MLHNIQEMLGGIDRMPPKVKFQKEENIEKKGKRKKNGNIKIKRKEEKRKK